MKNIQKKKAISSGTVIEAKADDNLRYYQYFFIALVSLLLLVNILFQNGISGIIIKRSWGMNNYSYFTWWVQAIVFILLFAIAVPSINNSFRLFFKKLTAGLDEKTTGKFRKLLRFIGISLVISLLFYLFRVKYDLLGDMDLRVSGSVEGKYINDEYFVMYFMHYLNIVLQKLFSITPHQTFVLASVGGGFFFSLFGLLIADLLFNDLFSVTVFFLFYITIGNILIFCGYTEIYAIPAASASLYMYTALLFLKKKVNTIFPFLCLVLAVALHKEQISLLPSFIFIATKKLPFVNKMSVKFILMLFIISIPLIYLLNKFLHLQELMPLTKDNQFPALNTLFSLSYWWELFNSQYISSGILIFLFILILFQAVKGQIKLDDYSRFFLIATLFIYSIVITMNKMRGSGDWDVCSFPAIYLSMFVAYIALTQWKAIYSPRKSFYIISTALLLNSLSWLAWIGLNSGEKSLNKIEDMVLTDPAWYYQAKLPAEMQLSVIFNKYGLSNKAIKYSKIGYEKYGDRIPYAITNYIDILVANKDTDEVIPVLDNTIANYKHYLNGYSLLFQIFGKRKQYYKMYNLAKTFVALYDTSSQVLPGDTTVKSQLKYCLAYLYHYSLASNDTATHHYAIIKMNQLNTILHSQ